MALKKIVANMTMSNNEMILLFPDVLTCMAIYDLDIKKMCFLYLLTYAKSKPQIAIESIPILTNDLRDDSPLMRALALRTLSAIPVKEFFDTTLEHLPVLLKDDDPYVRKTAAYAVAKLWNHEPKAVEQKGLITALNSLLGNGNPTVVASALAALQDITEKTKDLQLAIDRKNAFNLAHILAESNEWSQIYILGALMAFVPQESDDAVRLIDRVLPRLQHANASVVLGAIRLIVYLTNFVPDIDNVIPNLDRRIGPALVILLSKPPEIQYLALRNCILLLQGRPELLNLDVKVFFSKYNDPIYVKTTKLEIIFLLADASNIHTVLGELKECASEIDVQVVRKAVRAIGKLAIKFDEAADPCIEVLLELVSTRSSYIVQEAAVVIKNIFRRYPNRYESVISVLCDNLDSLDEPEAKAAMIWIVGHYADRIENSHSLLEDFLDGFSEEPAEVQLALLTATVKLFILRPTKGQEMVPKVLKMATEDSDNPDLRDRGFMYWRLLSTDPQSTKEIVMGVFPEISTDADRMDDERLEELELAIGTLATVYLKPIKQLFRSAKAKQLPQSPALAPRRNKAMMIQNEKRKHSQQRQSQQQSQPQLTNQFSTMTLNSPPNNNNMFTLNSNGSNSNVNGGYTQPLPVGATTQPQSANLIDIDDDYDDGNGFSQGTNVVTQNGMSAGSAQNDLLW